MKTIQKKIILLIALFQTVITFSQLSDKHWLPPLHSRNGNQVEDQFLYLSTAETVPFQVTITTGDGVAISGSPFTISSASPLEIPIGSGQPTSMFLDLSDVNIVKSDKGFILSANYDFYCSFRVRAANHAETLVSKGKPGIGLSFRLGGIINESTDNRKAFVASVMATENNTSVTLSGYNTGVVFSSGSGNITADTQTFTLNAGQSIVFSGYNDVPENLDGIIGALVTATKPVAVSCGNVFGGIASGGADILLDQIVSNTQIGDKYIFIRGNGTNQMELPLIVVDQDNTDIYVNGSALPVVTKNAGEYYFVPNSYYQGTYANNKNIFVKTSKPVYAYQMIGGDANTATSGMNFIPPLSCFFQSSVNIPAINRIGNTNYTADIMVLTYSNASVTINGGAISNANAQTVLGDPDWVTYRLSGYSGNVNVVSTGPLAVGVFGFSGAAGFAGYYSGFGSNPRDTPVTLCSSGTKNIFDAINGNPGPGGTWTVPVGSGPIVNNIFDPTINIAGEYKYSFSKSCNTANVGLTVKVFVTVQQANNVGTDTNLNVCTNNAPVDLFPLLGTSVTPGGTWSSTTTPALVNGVFNPAVNKTGVYFYTIPASGVCPALSAKVTVNNFNIPTILPITNLEICDNLSDGNDTNGKGTFLLNTKTPEILDSQTAFVVTYHLNSVDAVNNVNDTTTFYSGNTTIHHRITNPVTGCYNVGSFEIKVNPLPSVNNVITLNQCDDDTDAISTFNLNEANSLIQTIPNSSYSFTYFITQANALANTTPISNPTNFVSGTGNTVWARIYTNKNCARVAQVNLLVSATQIPSTFQPIVLEACDDYIDANDPADDGIDYFNFTNSGNQILGLFPASQNLSVSYYLSEADALAELNKITTAVNFRNTTPNNQTIWVRLDSPINNSCVGFGPYLNLVVNPLPKITIIDTTTLCVNPLTGAGTYAIDATIAGAGTYLYNWTPANTVLDALGNQSSILTVSTAGVYKVKVTNIVTGCSRQDQLQLFVSSEPVSVVAQLVTPLFSEGLATIQANVSGGFGVYEYSLNQVNWQASPVFNGLTDGAYTIYVRDVKQCGQIQSNVVQTITFANFFTPNNDGYNDTWNIPGVGNNYNGKIWIYDRYGKLIKQINPDGNGWDGTFNGYDLPATDYWFKAEYTENGATREFKSHFSLKR